MREERQKERREKESDERRKEQGEQGRANGLGKNNVFTKQTESPKFPEVSKFPPKFLRIARH